MRPLCQLDRVVGQPDRVVAHVESQKLRLLLCFFQWNVVFVGAPLGAFQLDPQIASAIPIIESWNGSSTGSENRFGV